jgi:hypothetical protein
MSNRRRNSGEGLLASFGIGFFLLWIVAFLASIGLTGVIIWAIIELVQHFTSN